MLLGGAALTRAYVEDDCWQGLWRAAAVAYARDAFDGLTLMDKVVTGSFRRPMSPSGSRKAGARSAKKPRTLGYANGAAASPRCARSRSRRSASGATS